MDPQLSHTLQGSHLHEHGDQEPTASSTSSTSSNANQFIDGYDSIDKFSQDILKKVMAVTKLCGDFLSGGSEWDYYTSFSGFREVMKVEKTKLTSLISKILAYHGVKGNFERRDLEEKFELLVDTNDTLLEQIGISLDEAAGLRKNDEPILVECKMTHPGAPSRVWNKDLKVMENKTGAQKYRLLAAKNVLRPQLQFEDKIDNRNVPFVPKIKKKWNAIKPLGNLLCITELGEEYLHPYQYELDHFVPPECQLEAPPSQQKPPGVASSPATLVTTPDELLLMMKHLKTQKEMAVDLEHHSYRSYQGITCLIQISTREKDFIVDALSLRSHLHALNEVFTDSTVLKVLHGATSDIDWLQRDFGVYLINMFDTHIAAKVLQIPQVSLAYLLKLYCGVTANKKYQLADWRIRPLPKELLLYAQEDTHYLLYIYDCLKAKLLSEGNKQKNLLLSVYEQSRQLCLQKYTKPELTDDSHLKLLRRSNRTFNNRQMFALRELFVWRDQVARETDESIGYVLPNHMLLHIAGALPRELQGVLACCNPIPPLVRQNANQLHTIVLHARQQPLISSTEELPVNHPNITQTKEVESLLNCPHDLSQLAEQHDNVSTLVNISSKSGEITENKQLKKNVRTVKITGPKISVFKDAKVGIQIDEIRSKKRNKKVEFLSPFERYRLVQPYLKTLQEEVKEVRKDEQLDTHLTDLKSHFAALTEQTVESALDQPPEKEVREEEPVIPKKATKRSASEAGLPDVDMSRVISLRKPVFQMKSKKKKKKKKTPFAKSAQQCAELAAACDRPSEEEPNTHLLGGSNLPTQSWNPDVPFDYGQMTYEQFRGGGGPQVAEQKKRKKKNNKYKSKVHKKFGNKSTTFKAFDNRK